MNAPTTQSVPFLDLHAAYDELRSETDAAIQRVLDSGWYILGSEVDAFEREFAAYVGAAHGIGVSNGLDALHLVLRAWDIGPGDEVIVPSHTFIATWLAVSMVGARPVPVEVDRDTYVLEPERAAAAITARTKAIIPVHLYGRPADVERFVAVAAPRGVRVLADAAQAHGARLGGRRVPIGDATAYSFYPGKNLGALGDGGAIVTDDEALAARVRALANYGSRRKYDHEVAGVNCRLDEIQAAVLRTRLPHLDSWNARRASVAGAYLTALADVPDLGLPRVDDGILSAWHLFVVEHPMRDALQAHLRSRGVGTLVHYPVPPHLSGAFAHLGLGAGSLPVAEEVASRVLSVPIGPHMTPLQVQHVIDAVEDFGRSAAP